jgi:hypothetical protein
MLTAIYFYLQMESSKPSESRTPIHDLLNTSNLSDNVRYCSNVPFNTITCMPFILGGVDVGGSITSNDIPPTLDPREWRRQWDRNRYKLMHFQKKEELLKKRR